MLMRGRHVRRPAALSALFLLLARPAISQAVTTAPSNGSDLLPVATSPRYLLNGSEIASFPNVRLAPLTSAVASLTQDQFFVSGWQSSILRSELTLPTY